MDLRLDPVDHVTALIVNITRGRLTVTIGRRKGRTQRKKKMDGEMNEALAQEGVAATPRLLLPGRTLCMDVGFNSAWRVYSSTLDRYGIIVARVLYRGKTLPFPAWMLPTS